MQSIGHSLVLSGPCADSLAPTGSDGSYMAKSDSGGGFALEVSYASDWDMFTCMSGKNTTNDFEYQADVECVCMLNG